MKKKEGLLSNPSFIKNQLWKIDTHYLYPEVKFLFTPYKAFLKLFLSNDNIKELFSINGLFA
jgi:hypothetical protein